VEVLKGQTVDKGRGSGGSKIKGTKDMMGDCLHKWTTMEGLKIETFLRINGNLRVLHDTVKG